MNNILSTTATLIFLFEGVLRAQAPPIPLAVHNRWIHKISVFEKSFSDTASPVNTFYDTVTVTAYKKDGDSILWSISGTSHQFNPTEKYSLEYIVYHDTIFLSVSSDFAIKKYFTVKEPMALHWDNGDIDSAFFSQENLKTPAGTFFAYAGFYRQSMRGCVNSESWTEVITMTYLVPGIGFIVSRTTVRNGICGEDASTLFEYRDTLVSFSIGPTSATQEKYSVSMDFGLSQNYPNPFNPSTQIRFTLRDPGFTSLKVYDLLGREVATLVNEQKLPGVYKVKWEAGRHSSGVYLLRLLVNEFVQTKTMILQR